MISPPLLLHPWGKKIASLQSLIDVSDFPPLTEGNTAMTAGDTWSAVTRVLGTSAGVCSELIRPSHGLMPRTDPFWNSIVSPRPLAVATSVHLLMSNEPIPYSWDGVVGGSRGPIPIFARSDNELLGSLKYHKLKLSGEDAILRGQSMTAATVVDASIELAALDLMLASSAYTHERVWRIPSELYTRLQSEASPNGDQVRDVWVIDKAVCARLLVYLGSGQSTRAVGTMDAVHVANAGSMLDRMTDQESSTIIALLASQNEGLLNILPVSMLLRILSSDQTSCLFELTGEWRHRRGNTLNVAPGNALSKGVVPGMANDRSARLIADISIRYPILQTRSALDVRLFVRRDAVGTTNAWLVVTPIGAIKLSSSSTRVYTGDNIPGVVSRLIQLFEM